MVRENELITQSIQFSVDLVNYYKWLCFEKREYVISRQLLRSGTSIGANIHEAQYAISRAEFNAKMQIALKEAAETEYWFRILDATGYLEKEFMPLSRRCEALKKMLVTSLKTSKKE